MRLEEEKFYHIYNRGNNKQSIFFEDENYSFFLVKFKKYLYPFVEVLAYCLMPNHFHFFIRVKQGKTMAESGKTLTPVEKAFRDFFISYSKAINKRYGRTGSLFQYKFKRKLIENNAYYSWLIFYIHSNPIKAGLVNEFSNWKYSSYRALLSNRPTLLQREQVINWFGDRNEFTKFHRENLQLLDSNQKDKFEGF